MTSTKTYYFTTVLRTIFTERKVTGIGDQPAYDDIASFDDYWNVRSDCEIYSKYFVHWFAGYERTGSQWTIRSDVVQWRKPNTRSIWICFIRK